METEDGQGSAWHCLAAGKQNTDRKGTATQLVRSHRVTLSRQAVHKYVSWEEVHTEPESVTRSNNQLMQTILPSMTIRALQTSTNN